MFTSRLDHQSCQLVATRMTRQRICIVKGSMLLSTALSLYLVYECNADILQCYINITPDKGESVANYKFPHCFVKSPARRCLYITVSFSMTKLVHISGGIHANAQHPQYIHISPMQETYILSYLKWQCAILAHSQNPQQPVTRAATYLQTALMVTDIQNISRFGWNLQSFRFSITGAVSVPIFGVPLNLSKSLITPNHN